MNICVKLDYIIYEKVNNVINYKHGSPKAFQGFRYSTSAFIPVMLNFDVDARKTLACSNLLEETSDWNNTRRRNVGQGRQRLEKDRKIGKLY